MRPGFLCRPNLGDIYRKEFIFLYHINLDIHYKSLYDSLVGN